MPSFHPLTAVCGELIIAASCNLKLGIILTTSVKYRKMHSSLTSVLKREVLWLFRRWLFVSVSHVEVAVTQG